MLSFSKSLFISISKIVYISIFSRHIESLFKLFNDLFNKFIVIFSKNVIKNRQITMKLKDLNEKNDKKTNEKFVLNIFHTIIIISNRSIILDFL